MFKRILRSGLSLFMASILFLTPASASLAADTQTRQTAQAQALSNVAGIQAEADKKADIITSIYGVTSLQYALISDNEIVVKGESGFTDIKKKTEPTQQTMYGIGSVSKIFTTLAILKLVDEARVVLDEPVVSYLPEFKMADERYKKITVRMLLNHSSGLMGSTLDNCMMLGGEDSWTHDHFLELLSEQRLKAEPGAFSVYCNDGFFLAEILVEKVSGQSFSKFIADNFTTPLQMTNTKTPMDSFERSQLAGIYNADGVKLPYEALCSIGAGGIYSTAEDLCKFAALFTTFNDIISENAISSMEYPEYSRGEWFPKADNAFSFGLGWDSIETYPFTQYNIKALVKGGDTIFNHASYIVLPEENMAVAVVTSGGSSGIAQIFGQSILLDVLKEKGRISYILPDKTFEKPVKKEIPDELMKYEGYYGSYNSALHVSMDKSGTLKISDLYGAQPEQLFTYTGDNRFYSYDGSSYVMFVDNNGKTYLYTSAYASLPLIGQTAMSIYSAQRLKPEKLSKSAAAAWKKYSGKNYFIISERYNSLIYIQGLGASKLEIQEDLPNYLASSRISDETTALAEIQIPGVNGRDLSDVKVSKKNGVVYVKSGNTVMISEDGIKNLSSKKSFTVTIPKDAYAKYYKVAKNMEGKNITVKLPKESSFAVYDKNGELTFSSYVSGKKTAKLPKGGYIMFSGSHGAKFNVSRK